jgi:hypothetical protein
MKRRLLVRISIILLFEHVQKKNAWNQLSSWIPLNQNSIIQIPPAILEPLFLFKLIYLRG